MEIIPDIFHISLPNLSFSSSNNSKCHNMILQATITYTSVCVEEAPQKIRNHQSFYAFIVSYVETELGQNLNLD